MGVKYNEQYLCQEIIAQYEGAAHNASTGYRYTVALRAVIILHLIDSVC